MIDEKFIFLALAFNLAGAFGYLISTIKGRTRPNRMTWLLWAAIPLVAFTAELDKGVGLVSLMTFIVGFNPGVIFLASFINKKSVWGLRKLDYICGGLAVLGIVLWQITDDANIAILFSILADTLAATPTIIKSYTTPESENYIVYLGASISAIITLLTIDTWNLAHWGFPLYILLADILLVALVKFRIGPKLQAAKTTS